KSLGHGADLVLLAENRVRDVSLNALLQDLRVRHKVIVAHELLFLANSAGELCPAVPVAFGHPVLDSDDRVLAGEIRQVTGEFRTAEAALFRLQLVPA